MNSLVLFKLSPYKACLRHMSVGFPYGMYQRAIFWLMFVFNSLVVLFGNMVLWLLTENTDHGSQHKTKRVVNGLVRATFR